MMAHPFVHTPRRTMLLHNVAHCCTHECATFARPLCDLCATFERPLRGLCADSWGPLRDLWGDLGSAREEVHQSSRRHPAEVPQRSQRGPPQVPQNLRHRAALGQNLTPLCCVKFCPQIILVLKPRKASSSINFIFFIKGENMK